MLVGGVVALPLEHWEVLGGGGEEGAGFADGLVAAVELGGPCAPAVSEQPVVDLAAQAAHVWPFGVGGQHGRGLLLVERFDSFRDGEVFVGDGVVGDAGVGHRHGHAAVAEQRGDGFQRHSTVDRLGRQGVPQLVWSDVAEAGRGGAVRDGPVDA